MGEIRKIKGLGGEKTMAKVNYEKDGRIARITLNRPEVLNAIDIETPKQISECVRKANDDQSIHVIIFSGAGEVFCSGYDLKNFAEGKTKFIQDMPWDPMKDYQIMKENTDHFMSLWRSTRPVLCKIKGLALAGGSDLALCSDMIFMEENAEIGYMPSRVWGCPTTAMWVYRLGAEKAKRMLFTGDKISGLEAEKIGLIYKAVSSKNIDAEVEKMAERICGVPVNQLMMQKLMINQTYENMGLQSSQMMATIFDGIARHSPEGVNFKKFSEETGWKNAVKERDLGTYNWTIDKPNFSSK